MHSKFQSTFFSFLPDRPTQDQTDLVERMERFLFRPYERAGFIIRGYAGTGKTTAVAAMVKTFPAFGLKSVLLAPTGRAAKVLAGFSKKPALTIHKKIYYSERTQSGQIQLKLAKNSHRNTVFIVDEASMIGDEAGNSLSGFTRGSLLDDLIAYVFSGENCRIVFIGDTAQLPPVGTPLSPALEPRKLMGAYGLQLKGVELTQVVRQAQDSGILYNATLLRKQMTEDQIKIQFKLNGFEDIRSINGMELEEELEQCYSKFDSDETMVICRSNKRANLFNQQVRSRIKFFEDEIATGDYLMIVKNNYFWLDEDAPLSFIANGDIAEILRRGTIEERYGFRFLDVSLRLLDYQLQPIEAKILLNSISSQSSSLSQTENKQLFEAVMQDYQAIGSKRKRMELIKKNPYFNALQIKFAYAITCHKAQGGQWKAVFIDPGYLTADFINQEYARWLYTAVSRATERLYLVNFPPSFFAEKQTD